MQLAIKRKDYERAFALAEAARARPGRAAAMAAASRPLQTVQRSAGTGRSVLALNQFDDELAVWVIKRRTSDVSMRPLSASMRQRLIARQQHEIWRGRATRLTAGAMLYNEIIRPVAAQLHGVTRLIVVPDATFQDVSFAALVEQSKQSRFLVEDVDR